MPNELEDLSLWWYGPEFVLKDTSFWPSSSFSSKNLHDTKESELNLIASNADESLFNKFSNLSTLESVTAYCLRFIQNASVPRENRYVGQLSAKEIKQALYRLLINAQSESFKSELAILRNQRPICKVSLVSLAPFLDKEGLLRVGGRLSKLSATYHKVHPILISAHHPLTKLIFKREHLRLLHPGPQLLLASLRQKFWPISGRSLPRKIVHTCLKCFKTNPRVNVPFMDSLPKSGVNPSPPFFTTGVDYAGPILIKNKKGRGCKLIKSYIVVFVCFSTKAIHLELVGDVTTESFLLALRRFTSRRGLPKHIYSDNGKTFIGARSELRELGKFLMSSSSEISNKSLHLNIEWKFIPACAPHFGGLWEAGVKSVKYHLKRVAGNAPLTFEDLYTLLVQVEAVLNSRPLTPLSTDPSDPLPLTPAHFLIGRPLNMVPDEDLLEVPTTRLSHHQRIQQLYQHFWTR